MVTGDIKKYFVTNGDGNVGIVVDSVYILTFSLDMDHMSVEGYTKKNIYIFGIIDCSVLVLISESC